MALSRQQLQATYPEGETVTCVVTRVEPFGVFVRLKEAAKVYGFIRPRDWSWSKRIFNITESISPGFAFEAVVTGYSPRKKLELSRRRAIPDPFPKFVENHKIGQVVLGQVTLVAHNDTGVVLMLEDGVEGFIPRSEIPHAGTREEGFGLLAEDWVAARIVGFQRDQVRLSIKEHLRDRARRDADRDDSQTALRFHPDIGPSLENIRLNLELSEISEPEVDPAVRERIQHILVVEDSVNVSESLEMIFEHFGFLCDRAGSIDEALGLLAKNEYDLLVLDVNLPSGDGDNSPFGNGGVELIRRLRTSYDSNSTPNSNPASDLSPIVFVLTATAAADWAEIIRHEPNATTCFFQKPTGVSRLLEQLSHLIQGRETQDDRHFSAGLDPTGSPQVRAHQGEHSPKSVLAERIQTTLEELKTDTQASQVVVLSFRPGPHFEVVGGDFSELSRDIQQELDISPVGDVVRQKRYLYVPDVSQHTQRFKHLLAIRDVGSFAGMALSYSDQSEYGLFLFGEQPNQLRSVAEEKLRTAGQLIGHYIAEHRLDQVITENQSLLLTGFLSDSLLHEIKNELQALADYTAVQVMVGKKHKDDMSALKRNEAIELKRTILGIQSVSQRLDELVVLFRNLAGRPPDETVDLNHTVERLQETIKPFAHSHNVHLEVDLDSRIPVLTASPKLIDQTLLNVMINGIEQLAVSGGSQKKITVCTRFGEDAEFPVEVLIRDTGRGVHWVHREKIFDLFFTTKARGTGLGLYISRFFIEQLGGRLRLRKSVLFSGSEFAIELPKRVIP